MSLPSPSPTTRAVVTGASQGIGRELARNLARRGHSLILVARREEVLAALATELEGKHGVTVEVRACDLSDPQARGELCAELAERSISILCNNAGTATFGPLLDQDPKGEQAQVQLNANAVQDLVLAVLPGMRQRRAGGILNVGSAAGNMAIPNNATYAATKAFVNSFSESLRGELKGSGVSVTLMAPGPVRTELRDDRDKNVVDRVVPNFLWTSASDAAEDALEALARNRRRVVPGALSKGMNFAGTYLPRGFTAPITGRFYSRLVEED